MLVAGVVVLLVAAVTALAVWNLKPSPPRPVTRTVINLPAGQQLASLTGPTVALSPDGSRLVYVASQGSAQQLYLRALDSLEAKPIPGTEGAGEPFFSADGQWLGFFAGEINFCEHLTSSPCERAAARALLERKLSEGPCGCAYHVGVDGDQIFVSDGPFIICERHTMSPLTKLEIERDKEMIRAQFS